MRLDRTDTCRKTTCLLSVPVSRPLVLLALLLTSCRIDRPLEECRYNVQISYQYLREMSDTRNMIDSYVHSIDEYIFDRNGVLLDSRKVQGSACSGKSVSESTLPPGLYSVVAVGNLGLASSLTQVVPGTTRLEDMMLWLDNPHPVGGWVQAHNDSEKLYYGYGTFEVRDKKVSHIKVNMFHSHCVLSITVRWKTKIPDDMRDLYMTYKEVPGQYSFRPGYVIQNSTWHGYDPSFDDYPMQTADNKFYTPWHGQTTRTVVHKKDVNINVDRKIITQFITYRYRSNSPLLISLHAGPTQIMKEIDLSHFFTSMGIDLDKNFRQEFNLQFVIDGDNVHVGFISLSDWEEGGVIGRQ